MVEKEKPLIGIFQTLDNIMTRLNAYEEELKSFRKELREEDLDEIAFQYKELKEDVGNIIYGLNASLENMKTEQSLSVGKCPWCGRAFAP